MMHMNMTIAPLCYEHVIFDDFFGDVFILIEGCCRILVDVQWGGSMSQRCVKSAGRLQIRQRHREGYDVARCQVFFSIL